MTRSTIFVTDGGHLDRYDADGRLIDLTDHEIAANAFCCGGVWYGPVRQWVKDFDGQITDGRVGRPSHRFAPLSWCGESRKKAVLALLEAAA